MNDMPHIDNIDVDPAQMELFVNAINNIMPEPRALHGYFKGERFHVTTAPFIGTYTPEEFQLLIDKHSITLSMLYNADAE